MPVQAFSIFIFSCLPERNIGVRIDQLLYPKYDLFALKVIVLNTGIFWLLRTCSASFDHLIGEKTRMYFAKSLSDSIMNSYSLLPNITILIMQSTSMALQRI